MFVMKMSKIYFDRGIEKKKKLNDIAITTTPLLIFNDYLKGICIP